MKVPVGAIVKLSQAPQNSIKRLKGLDAYANIVGSVSSIRWSRKIMDEITSLMSQIAMNALFRDGLPSRQRSSLHLPGWYHKRHEPLIELLTHFSATRLSEETVDNQSDGSITADIASRTIAV